jgi:hypothetical protein
MNKLYRVLILLVFFGLGIQCASAANTISFNPQTVQMDMGSSQKVQVAIDNVPDGLSGFNITISVLDPKIAEITAFSFPGWSTLPRNSTFPSSSVWVQCFDGGRNVDFGYTNVSLGNITLTGKKSGTADLNISVDSYYDTDKVKGNINRIYPNAIPSKINILQSTPSITWSNPADITYGTALSETQLNAVAKDPVTGNTIEGTYTYTPASGAVLNVGNAQNLHFVFTPTDATNYNEASADVQINVNKATPAITWINPADITYGTALSETQLNAVAKDPVTGNPIEGTYTYTPAGGTILNVGNGQNLHVVFTPTDATNYNEVSADVQINVLEDVEQSVTDNDQPEIQSVTLFPANTTAGSKIDISANITDDVGVAEVTAGDIQMTNINGNWRGNITAPSSPGKYSLSIKANDAAGNTVDTSVPYNVVRRQGSVNAAVLPTVSKVAGGESTTVAIKVKNTQNIDDTFKVRVSVNGLPAFYRAGTSWFNWTEKTVNLGAKQEVLIPIEMKVPVGTVTGLKTFKASVNSEKFSVHGSGKGYLVIPRPSKNVNKQIGPKELWYSR